MRIALLFFLTLLAPAARADEPLRFTLALYHFNVEFVAGSRSAEDAVVTESFEPLVDLYLRHPDWGADLEMQGCMIEILAKRHPAVLAKLQRLLDAGRVELVCCHYSDQLVLAFPRVDLERGLEIDARTLTAHGLPRAPVIFFQEGQFGEGLLEVLRGHGDTIAVAADGAYDFSHPEDKDVPLLSSRGILVVPGDRRAFALPDGSRVETDWSKLGDGERVATGSDPYGLKKPFQFDPALLAAYEQELQTRAARGDRMASIVEYVAQMKARGLAPTPCKPYLDTPWKGAKADNVWLWLGRHDLPIEDDTGIRAENARARIEVLRAEAVLRAGGEDEERIAPAWKHLLKAEVSDATGWAPLPIEMDYARGHAQRAIDAARAIDGDAERWIDTRTGRYVEAPPPAARADVDAGPVPAQLRGGQGSLRWARLGEDVWEVRAAFSLLPWKLGLGSVAFPVTEPVVRYSPAGLDEQVVEIAWQDLAPRQAHLALANGLVGLGGDLWAIQDHARGYSACRVTPTEAAWVVEGGARPKHDWRFLVVRGKARALELAVRTNVWPVVRAGSE